MNQPEFPTVFRGYDPDQVDRHLTDLYQVVEVARQESAELAVELTRSRQAHDALAADVEQQQRIVNNLREHARTISSPTFANLGERIGSMLSLADEEAAQIRGDAIESVEVQRLAVAQEAASARSQADAYAQQTRSRADDEAAEAVSRAKAEADSILDEASREAAARHEEAEAYFEQQQANAAAAASDLEMTLGERREQSSAEFTAQVASQDQALAAVRDRADLLAHESEEDRRAAAADAARQLEAARTEAAALVNAAKEQAERIRRDSERELTAATARRDSITAQLSNVRSMLATLGGGAALKLADDEHPGGHDLEPDAGAEVAVAQPHEAQPQGEVADAHGTGEEHLPADASEAEGGAGEAHDDQGEAEAAGPTKDSKKTSSARR